MSLKKNMGDAVLSRVEYPVGTKIALVAHVVSGKTETRTTIRDGKNVSFPCRDAMIVVCDGMPWSEIRVAVEPERRKNRESEDTSEYATECVVHPGMRISLRFKSGEPQKHVGQIVVVNVVLYSTRWLGKDGVMHSGFRGECDQPFSPLRTGIKGNPPVTLPVSEFRGPSSASVPLRGDMDQGGREVHGVVSNLESIDATFSEEKKPCLRFRGEMNGVPVGASGYSLTNSLGLGRGEAGPACGDAWARFATLYLALGRPVCSAKINGDLTLTEIAANSGRVIVDNAGLSMPTATELARFALPISTDAAKKVIDKMDETTLVPATVADANIYLLPGKHAGSRMSIIGADDAKARIWYLPGISRKPADPARVLAAVEAAAKLAGDDTKRIDALNAALGGEAVASQAMLLVMCATDTSGVDAPAEIRGAWQRISKSFGRGKRAREEPVDSAAAPAKAAHTEGN